MNTKEKKSMKKISKHLQRSQRISERKADKQALRYMKIKKKKRKHKK